MKEIQTNNCRQDSPEHRNIDLFFRMLHRSCPELHRYLDRNSRNRSIKSLSSFTNYFGSSSKAQKKIEDQKIKEIRQNIAINEFIKMQKALVKYMNQGHKLGVTTNQEAMIKQWNLALIDNTNTNRNNNRSNNRNGNNNSNNDDNNDNK